MRVPVRLSRSDRNHHDTIVRAATIITMLVLTGCTGSLLRYSHQMQRVARAGSLAAQVMAEELQAEATPAAEARARVQHSQLSEQYDACLSVGRSDCERPLSEQLLLDDELMPWTRLLAVTATMGELAGLWGRMNLSWGANGSVPPDWNSRLCQPLGDAIQMALVLMDQIGVEVAGSWRVIAVLAPEVCLIGVEEVSGDR